MLNIDDRLIKEVSPKIGANALSVLLAIAIHLNQKTNRCFPSHFRLMELTGLGRDAVYKALSVLQANKLLKSRQSMGGRGKISRREFQLSTDFIQIFVSAASFTLPENTDPKNTDTENTDTKNQDAEHINKSEQINEFEQINECEHAPAQNEKSFDLNTPIERGDIGPGAVVVALRMSDFPKAKNSAELYAELQMLYTVFPEEWRATIAGTPAQMWALQKRQEVLSRFCAWAIAEGYERRTFRQINARLNLWFRDEPHMGRNNHVQETPRLRPVKTA